jgi:hypothetical protein
VSRRQGPRRDATTGPQGCTVTVCRGCCCGTVAKHPDVDHAAQLTRLRTALTGTAQVRTSDCLDACEHSNVIVVTPSPAGRLSGGRPAWLEFALDLDVIDDVNTWVSAGGPGLADPPPTLDLYTFTPPRRVRQAIET